MKQLIMYSSILFVIASCKTNINVFATSHLENLVYFVDSMDQFNSNYLTDKKYEEIPFEDFFPAYRKQFVIIDSLDKKKCFNDEQKCELQCAKRKFDLIVDQRLNDFIHLVDSSEKFDAYYKTTFDTVYADVPISQNHPEKMRVDTMFIKHEGMFNAPSNNLSAISFKNSFIAKYMHQSMLMDSIDHSKCFNEKQKTELQKAKKKFTTLVEQGQGIK